MYLNKATIVGNLTRDPELRAMPNGSKVCNFSIATNRVWITEGQKQEAVDFHNIVVFGNSAEASAQYLGKGQKVLVEGRLQTRSWDSDNGQKNYRTEIIADKVQFGPRKNADSQGVQEPESHSQESEPEEPKSSWSGNQSSKDEYPANEINPDDIPF